MYDKKFQRHTRAEEMSNFSDLPSKKVRLNKGDNELNAYLGQREIPKNVLAEHIKT